MKGASRVELKREFDSVQLFFPCLVWVVFVCNSHAEKNNKTADTREKTKIPKQ